MGSPARLGRDRVRRACTEQIGVDIANVSSAPKSCEQCSASFKPTSNRQKCCLLCAVSSRPCETCGIIFEYPAKRKSRKYCSASCSARANSTPERMAAMRSQVKNPHDGTTKPKECTKCGEVYQPTSARQRICFTCTPNRSERGRLRRYGLSGREWDELAGRFDGMCWICRTQPAGCVDHDHETGAIRGALCRTCNMVLHYVERPGWWADARAYLEGGSH